MCKMSVRVLTLARAMQAGKHYACSRFVLESGILNMKVIVQK